MRLIAGTAFNRESDILESFCRYTLTFCDELLMVKRPDAGSDCDKIVEGLINEGLKIKFYDLTKAFNKTEDFRTATWRYIVNELPQKAFTEFEADWYMLLDADEFIIRADEQNPRISFENFDDKKEYRIKWRSYLYNDTPRDNSQFAPLLFNECRIMPNEWEKPAISRYLYEKLGAYTVNTHFLTYPDITPDVVIPDDTLICHYPVRSAPQIIVKAVTGWMDLYPGNQYDYLASILIKGDSLAREDLVSFSNTYSIHNPTPEDKSDTAIVPFPTGWFEKPIMLKYTDYAANGQNYIISELMRKYQEIFSGGHSIHGYARLVYEHRKLQAELSKCLYPKYMFKYLLYKFLLCLPLWGKVRDKLKVKKIKYEKLLEESRQY